MEYVYWKQYDNKNYSFEEAFNIIKDNRNIQMRVVKPDSYKEIRIDYDSLTNKNIEDIELPLWAIRDNYWHLYVPDYEMENKINELRNYLDSIYNIDTTSKCYTIPNYRYWLNSTLINNSYGLEASKLQKVIKMVK